MPWLEVATDPSNARVGLAFDVTSKGISPAERLLATANPLFAVEGEGTIAALKDGILLQVRELVEVRHQQTFADVSSAGSPILVAEVGPEVPPEVRHTWLAGHLVLAGYLGTYPFEASGSGEVDESGLHQGGSSTGRLVNPRRWRLSRFLRCRVWVLAPGLGGRGWVSRPALAPASGGLSSAVAATRSGSGGGGRGVF